MFAKLNIILLKFRPSQGYYLVESRIVIFVDISNFLKTKSKLIVNDLLLATVDKRINKTCEIIKVEFTRFNQNRFDVAIVDKTFVIDNSYNAIFICVVFLYGFCAIEHTKAVDDYIPLIIDVQGELPHPTIQFLCEYVLFYGVYFRYLFPDALYTQSY